MMKDQHTRVCLGHRAENRIMIRARCLLQGRAALLAPYVILLSSVLLVRAAIAQEFGRLSPVQEPTGPWENPFGDSPPNIAINALREGQGAAPSGADVVSVLPQFPPPFPIPQSVVPSADPNAGTYEEPWSRQLMPEGLLYHAYLAGNRESRFGMEFVSDENHGSLWDIALGGHLGLIRYGSPGATDPQGWQLDIEGAVFPRLTLDANRDMVANDFRFGVLLTMRQGPWEGKFGGYHLSSHFGDQFLYENPDVDRIHYSRTGFVVGGAYRPAPTGACTPKPAGPLPSGVALNRGSSSSASSIVRPAPPVGKSHRSWPSTGISGRKTISAEMSSPKWGGFGGARPAIRSAPARITSTA